MAWDLQSILNSEEDALKSAMRKAFSTSDDHKGGSREYICRVVGFEDDKTALVRIVANENGEFGDHTNYPQHIIIPDICDPATAKDPQKVKTFGVSHTRCYGTNILESEKVEVGDFGKVLLAHGTFEDTLQYGQWAGKILNLSKAFRNSVGSERCEGSTVSAYEDSGGGSGVYMGNYKRSGNLDMYMAYGDILDLLAKLKASGRIPPDWYISDNFIAGMLGNAHHESVGFQSCIGGDPAGKSKNTTAGPMPGEWSAGAGYGLKSPGTKGDCPGSSGDVYYCSHGIFQLNVCHGLGEEFLKEYDIADLWNAEAQLEFMLKYLADTYPDGPGDQSTGASLGNQAYWFEKTIEQPQPGSTDERIGAAATAWRSMQEYKSDEREETAEIAAREERRATWCGDNPDHRTCKGRGDDTSTDTDTGSYLDWVSGASDYFGQKLADWKSGTQTTDLTRE